MKRCEYGNVYMTTTPFEKKLPLYLTCVGGWEHQYPIRRANGWPDFQWIQCTGGQGKLYVCDEEHEVRPGQGALLFPNEFHNYYATVEPWSVRWFSFNGRQADAIVRSLQFERSAVLHLSDPQPTLARIDELKEAASANETNYLECSALLYRILLDLYEYAERADVRSPHQSFSQLSPALRHIEEHAHEPLSLRDIASQLGVSEYHTCVLFRKTLGMRPFEYINRIRVRKAKVLLQNEPSLNVADIARMVGFESESYFIKMFKRIQGVTPNKFRIHS